MQGAVRRRVLAALAGLAAWWSVCGVVWAIPNLQNLIPFGKRVEADPTKTYLLTEDQGPWMILACSFSGPGAEQQAHELVLELRQRFNLEAYQHKRTFDYTEPVQGLGYDKYGNPRRMRYRQNVKIEEIGVLVGNFDSPDEPAIQATLHKIKYARPDCLDLEKRKTSYQRFAGLRELQRRLSPDPEKKEMGPMRAAFVTRNPLLPEEYFRPTGIDPVILQMNTGAPYSLLECPGKYTVRVASFRGEATMKVNEPLEKRSLFGRGPSKLEQAAEKAHRLTMALREKGIEAYQWHDIFESVVTIGSFDSVGTPRPDGYVEINPDIHAIIETYRARPRPLPNGLIGLEPKMLDGIPFDVQPLPVRVPKVTARSAGR
ncbi:MAG: hypothetical protein KatS3mg110_3829 [Pirellulaceae bacterium]|nr:MAG: hypothetical protein KatS3mg110_3829 [Pirellulaceae bacterium]